MQMFVNDLILNACVKTTEMFICEKILTTSGKKITSNPYTNGDTLLSAVFKHFSFKLYHPSIHHLASVVCRLSSVNFSHFKLLLRNHRADCNQT